LLSKIQREHESTDLQITEKALDDFALMLCDFAFDIHCDSGIWKAYESCNTELFGVPLPITHGSAEIGDDSEVIAERIHHFLWVIYSELFDDVAVSPDTPLLRAIASQIHNYFAARLPTIPADCGVKTFLQKPDNYGWNLKKKLIWLGTQSFLFRLFFRFYAEENQDQADRHIALTDDFLCRECTRFSGLGPVDILAVTLDLNDCDRRDLLEWKYRHTAPFRIQSLQGCILQVQNLVNNQIYRVRMPGPHEKFNPGRIIVGSLVPYRKEWYWSGGQQAFQCDDQAALEEFIANWRRKAPGIVCRYDKNYEKKVRQAIKRKHEESLAYYGTVLKTYSDGLSLAADIQKEMEKVYKSRPREEVERVIKKHGLKNGRPRISLPQELVDCSEGIGMFLNPKEGKEFMTGFHALTSGLGRGGEGLSEEEKESIRGFILSDSISPAFVKHVAEKYGRESIKAAFNLSGSDLGCWLDYLLRTHKGEFYVKRYPQTLSLV